MGHYETNAYLTDRAYRRASELASCPSSTSREDATRAAEAASLLASAPASLPASLPRSPGSKLGKWGRMRARLAVTTSFHSLIKASDKSTPTTGFNKAFVEILLGEPDFARRIVRSTSTQRIATAYLSVSPSERCALAQE